MVPQMIDEEDIRLFMNMCPASQTFLFSSAINSSFNILSSPNHDIVGSTENRTSTLISTTRRKSNKI